MKAQRLEFLRAGTVLVAAWLAGAIPTLAHGDWAGYSRYGALAQIDFGNDSVTTEICLRDTRIARLGKLVGLGPATKVTPEELAQGLVRLTAKQGLPGPPRIETVQRITPDQGTGTDCAVPGETSFRITWIQPLSRTTRQLTIEPPLEAGPDDVGLVALHHGVPLGDPASLTRPVQVALDAEDPWRSRIDDPAFVRRHNEPRSFLYVEPYEVRHELLIRWMDLSPAVYSNTANSPVIPPESRAAVLQPVGAYLEAHNPLQIDGVDALPRIDRIEFVRFTRAGVRPVAENTSIDTRSALIGVQLVYLTERPARSLRLRWELFGQDAESRAVSVIRGPETFDGYMTRTLPVFEWTQDDAFDPLPVGIGEETPPPHHETPTVLRGSPPSPRRRGIVLILSGVLMCGLLLRLLLRDGRGALWFLLLAGGAVAAGSLASWRSGNSRIKSDETRAAVVATLEPLLHNAYRAFQLRAEEAAYDRLALSLESPLLDEIYLQHRRALLRQSEGLGGEGKVSRVEVREAEVSPGDRAASYVVDAHWIAYGTVSHWGHSHPRQNAYRARITLTSDANGHWKIAALRFVEGQQLERGGET